MRWCILFKFKEETHSCWWSAVCRKPNWRRSKSDQDWERQKSALGMDASSRKLVEGCRAIGIVVLESCRRRVAKLSLWRCFKSQSYRLMIRDDFEKFRINKMSSKLILTTPYCGGTDNWMSSMPIDSWYIDKRSISSAYDSRIFTPIWASSRTT